MITDEQLDEIEVRLTQATPAPWQYFFGYDNVDNEGRRMPQGSYVYAPAVSEPYPGLNDKAKRAVRARNMGRLVAEIHSIDKTATERERFGVFGNYGSADGEFIAHARQDVQDLLDEVRRLKKRIVELKTNGY